MKQEKKEIQEAKLITNEIQTHVEKLNTFPEILGDIKEKEIELSKLIEEGKDLSIDGLEDKAGAKKISEHRLNVRRLRLDLEKQYDIPISASNHLHKFFISKKDESISPVKEDEKKKKKQVEDWRKEVQEAKEAEIERQRLQYIERSKVIRSYGCAFDGYQYTFQKFDGEILQVANIDEIQAFSDAAYDIVIQAMEALKEKEAEEKQKLLTYRKGKLKAIIDSDHWATPTDEEIISYSEDELNKIIKDREADLEEFRKNKDNAISFLINIGWEQHGSKLKHFIGEYDLNGYYFDFINEKELIALKDSEQKLMFNYRNNFIASNGIGKYMPLYEKFCSGNDFIHDCEKAFVLKKEADQKEQVRLDQIEQDRKDLEAREKALEVKEQEIKEEAEKLERERKERLRKRCELLDTVKGYTGLKGDTISIDKISSWTELEFDKIIKDSLERKSNAEKTEVEPKKVKPSKPKKETPEQVETKEIKERLEGDVTRFKGKLDSLRESAETLQLISYDTPQGIELVQSLNNEIIALVDKYQLEIEKL